MTLQATLFPRQFGFFVWASRPFLCCSWRIEIMQMEMGRLKEKCWHLPSLLPPKYTHIMHTPFMELSFGPVWWCLSLLAVSQAYFNNRSHIACVPFFLLSILAHLRRTGQVRRQEDRMLSAAVTNNIGLSNSRRKGTAEVKVALSLKKNMPYFDMPAPCRSMHFKHRPAAVQNEYDFFFLASKTHTF